MRIVNKFKRDVVKSGVDAVIYFVGVANLIIICVAYGLGQWVRGTTSNDLSSAPMIKGDCIDANGGNHCNVNVRGHSKAPKVSFRSGFFNSGSTIRAVLRDR